MNNTPLIEVKNLKKYFTIKKSILGTTTQVLKAVDDVSFSINKGETFGLVGESGCGKSTLGRTIMRLYDSNGGEIYYNGTEITKLSNKELKEYRKKMQIVLQDPFSSLNPHMSVKEIIREPLAMFTNLSKKEQDEEIYTILNKVGLNESQANMFPNDFSGGQRQRVGIARALAIKPEFIFCDEPISALDVSIQAQIVNMLEDLQEEYGLTYLFIAHDLSMVRHISHRIGVMYLGKIVEISNSEDLYTSPLHPYTQALLSSIPIHDPDKASSKQRIMLYGDVPSPINPPSGCAFRTRCKHATEKCKNEIPSLRNMGNGHFVACHLI